MEKKPVKKPAKKKAAPKKSVIKHDKAGQPTKYRPEMCEKVYELATQGFYNDKISKELGITNQTLHAFMKDHPEFLDAIKRGKAIADEKVERTLFEMATGYSHQVYKPMVVGTGMGESQVKVIEYIEKLPPNMTAIIFHLKNRKPQEWRDKQEILQETTLEIKHTFDPKGI
jgi:hypothetical protein